MKFSIYISSINIEQYNKLNEFIESNSENSFFIHGKLKKYSFDRENVFLTKTKEKFCNSIVDSDILINIGVDNFIEDESIVNSFLSSKVKPIYHLDINGEINERNYIKKEADILFVFPGAILPLNLGSHQRSFNLIYQLKKIGLNVDLLITAPRNTDIDTLKDVLSYFCNNVYLYENQKKNLPKILTIGRFIEKKVKQLSGRTPELPDLFSERLKNKPNKSCKEWVNSLFLKNCYKHIIVSYAWMLPCVEYIKHSSDNFNLICDTHDVQFIRNQDIFKNKDRLISNEKLEKKMEIEILNSCQSVLAISISDQEILSQSLNKKTKVLKASAGFDYALLPVKQRPLRQPFRFGFIGGKMDANVKSLEFILDNWWPEIKRFSPESKFFIAGSICNHPKIFSKVFLEENIIRLGFVDSLSEFYSKIDVSLNPVLVQGGLNFKSVEAVFSGKFLVTNALGKKCLGLDFPAIVVDKPCDLSNYLSNLEFDYKLDKAIRVNNQNKALEMFGNNVLKNVLLQDLFNYL